MQARERVTTTSSSDTDRHFPLPAGAFDPGATAWGDVVRILAVDDDLANLLAIEAALGARADRLVVARSGDEALRHLLVEDFAVILLDVRMPSPDGFETARMIRERLRTRHIPIIFMTAYRDTELEMRRGYELGAVDYLFKPIVPEVLQAKVEVFVTLRERTATVARQAEELRRLERAEAARQLAEERRAWEAAALRAQVSHLEDDARRKDDFLAMLAHELRNPLASVVSHLEVLRLRSEDPRIDGSRTAILRQVEHLTRMIDDLLDVSRITRGKLRLEREPLELERIVERAIETCQPMLADRRVALSVEPPAEPIPLFADPARLTQVLSNLIGNACRYSEPGSPIWIRWWREDDTAVLEVADRGCGISPELLERIFDRFVQERRSGRGLGLGLTLVRQLVELHGGVVEARSEGVGRGAQFLVRLVVADRHAQPSPGSAPAEPVASRPPPPLDVVVVEDDAEVCEAICALLAEWGYAVRASHDGTAAVDEMVSNPPQLAFLDLGLPGLDGYEVARRVRTALGARSPRLVALTGFDDPRLAANGPSPFDAHLVKPASALALERELAATVASPETSS
ncbi:MAG: response regulator [Sandaracinaceae bacterium]|nr:response regulator [Sandaracinaceae bacterium]